MPKPLVSALVLIGLSNAAFAESHEVRMLNSGEAGPMVFDPSFLEIAPGDTVKFLATDPGHNAEAIPDMIPDEAEAFSGGIDEEISVTLENEGLYAVRCTPHFAMGMVMTIAVGEVESAPDGYLEGRLPAKAVERFEQQLSNL